MTAVSNWQATKRKALFARRREGSMATHVLKVGSCPSLLVAAMVSAAVLTMANGGGGAKEITAPVSVATAEAVEPNDRDLSFVHSLQEALATHDFHWLGEHIDFPLEIRTSAKSTIWIGNEASIKDHFDQMFPAATVNYLSHLAPGAIRRSAQGIEIGSSGIVCLPVPSPMRAGSEKYCIYRVGESLTLPKSEISARYPISWGDRVFFIEVKEALRHNCCSWLASHVRMPFTIKKALGVQHIRPTPRWLEEHCDAIWYQPRAQIISPEEWPTYRPSSLRSTLAESLLNFPTLELWKNWQGVMADNGTLWFWGYNESHGSGLKYEIIAINPIGSSQ